MIRAWVSLKAIVLGQNPTGHQWYAYDSIVSQYPESTPDALLIAYVKDLSGRLGVDQLKAQVQQEASRAETIAIIREFCRFDPPLLGKQKKDTDIIQHICHHLQQCLRRRLRAGELVDDLLERRMHEYVQAGVIDRTANTKACFLRESYEMYAKIGGNSHRNGNEGAFAIASMIAACNSLSQFSNASSASLEWVRYDLSSACDRWLGEVPSQGVRGGVDTSSLPVLGPNGKKDVPRDDKSTPRGDDRRGGGGGGRDTDRKPGPARPGTVNLVSKDTMDLAEKARDSLLAMSAEDRWNPTSRQFSKIAAVDKRRLVMRADMKRDSEGYKMSYIEAKPPQGDNSKRTPVLCHSPGTPSHDADCERFPRGICAMHFLCASRGDGSTCPCGSECGLSHPKLGRAFARELFGGLSAENQSSLESCKVHFEKCQQRKALRSNLGKTEWKHAESLQEVTSVKELRISSLYFQSVCDSSDLKNASLVEEAKKLTKSVISISDFR